MFEAKFSKAFLMKNIIETMKGLLNDVCFDFSDDGIAVQSMDCSHVALISLKIELNGFSAYYCTRRHMIGINLVHLAKVMKCAENSDQLMIQYHDNSDILTLVFENQDKKKQSVYELHLIDLDTNHLSIPEQKYACKLKISSINFQHICHDLIQFGDSLSIVTSEQGIQFSTKGDDIDGKVFLPQTELSQTESLEGVNVTFSLKYLNLFTKAAAISERVQLFIANELPIMVKYDLSPFENIGNEKQKSIGNLCFHLAPKILD